MMIATAVCRRLLVFFKEAPRSGTVHSVFDHAVNLEFEEREGLAGLIAKPKAFTPYAVSVRTEIPFSQAGVRAGMAAVAADGRIIISQAGLEIDCLDASSVDLSLDSISISPAAQRSAQAEILDWVLAEADAGESLAPLATGAGETVYTRFLAPRFSALEKAVWAEDEKASTEAAERFAGCGPGLTPSSDDLLCGFLAVMRLLAREQKRENLPNLIARTAIAAAKKTNRISATFLLQCGEGLVNEPVLDLLTQIFQNSEPDRIRHAAKRVLEIGSTSGADMLTGIALALRQRMGGNEH
ncbi:MAG: DUF2877 domain-containing protein [Eubacteriales bacterium]|nr:DUF2877 domain-containing protein [Eubacteriales bacterium]